MKDMQTGNIYALESLTDALRHWSREKSDAVALTFLSGNDADTLTYLELHNRALEIGNELSRICTPGTRVVLGFEQQLDYVSAFFGCVYAGAVGVTSAPPDELRRSKRLNALLADSGAKVILTNNVAADKFKRLTGAGDITVLNTDTLSGGRLAEPYPAEKEELMFLQYTSGSTSAPRGVMLTHGSIAANLKAINADMQPHDDSIYVSWLPLYHDMGLIFMTLAPLFAGCPVYLISPAEFLRYPDRWLRAISTYGGTITAAPNFAYRLCVERTPDALLKELDLSRMEKLINGSEPVRVEDMEAFHQRFAVSGLRKAAVAGGYGMAEVGVYVSCGEMLTGQMAFDRSALENERFVVPLSYRDEATRLVAPCGRVNATHYDLHIVDPETLEECTHDRVGEIWLAGPSKGQGYWKNHDITEAVFRARLAGQSQSYLRTGDLGFVYQGSLYICGRIKEMMILRGRNVFPFDLCAIVENIGQPMRGRRAAAFTVPGDTEDEVVIVCAAKVSKANWRRLAEQIIGELSTQAGVIPADVVFVKNRALMRTTSGKVQHSALRAAYLDGSLSVNFSLRGLQDEEAPVAEPVVNASVQDIDSIIAPDWMARRIGQYCSIICNCEVPPPEQNLFELGLDSLRGVQLIQAIESDLLGHKCPITLSELIDLKTPQRIASVLARSMAPAGAACFQEIVL
jgi:acyl-CoA synthetase (AMP-forming)/AMP-acid ligase II/acyl carrier protein